MAQQPTQLEQYQAQRIEALTAEVTRLNDELEQAKNALLVIESKSMVAAKRIVITDPNFFRPISEMNVEFEIVEPLK